MAEIAIRAGAKHHPPALRFKCRAEFVNGEATLPMLHQKYGVPLATLKDWCFSGKWSAAREVVSCRQFEDPPESNQEQVQMEDLSALTHARAREYQTHLVRLRTQLAGETDPQKIDRLCAAIARLEDVFCRYAGIPLPGSRKPEKERPKPKFRYVEPL